MIPAVWDSVLLLSICGAAVACGLFAANGDLRPPLHKLLLLAAGALALSAFGLALTMTLGAMWIRAAGWLSAGVGWSLTAAFSLHAVLIALGYGNLFGKRAGYAVVYLPAALSVGLNTFFEIHIDTIGTHLLTRNAQLPRGPFESVLSLGYPICASAICSVLLLHWLSRAAHAPKTLGGRIYVGTVAVSSLLCAVFNTLDIFWGMGNLLLPLFFAFFSIAGLCMLSLRQHVGLCGAEIHGEAILLQSTRRMVYAGFSYFSILGGVLILFGTSLFGGRATNMPAAMSGIGLMLLGAAVTIVDRRREWALKELMMAFLFAFGAPSIVLWLMYFQYYEAWALLFPMMIVGMLSGKRILLGTTMLQALLIQLFLWACAPFSTMPVNTGDYLFRLAVMALSIFLAFYVGYIYIGRLNKNTQDTQAQAILEEVSHAFIVAGEDNLDWKLHKALQCCGKFLRCDMATLVLQDRQTQAIRYVRTWWANEDAPRAQRFLEFQRTFTGRIIQIMEIGSYRPVINVSRLSPARRELRASLLACGIKFSAVYPIRENGGCVGLLSFGAGRPLKTRPLRSGSFLEIVVATLSDAIVNHEQKEEADFLAFHDQFTHLPNRALFKQKLQEAILQAEQQGLMCGVLFLDLDSFKAVNDTLGHDRGDQLLRRVAERLRETAGPRDTVARFGGDEFVLLIPRVADAQETLQAASHIMEVIQKPVTIDHQEIFITCSLGIALFPQDGKDPETLLKYADEAMYHAKSIGKNRFVRCSEKIRAYARQRQELTGLLYHARENGQLELLFQPCIHTKTHAVTEIKTLLRWRLPGRDALLPPDFIPLAERIGIIRPVGLWMMRSVCRQNKAWQDAGLPKVRVSCSLYAGQLRDPHLIDNIALVLKETGLPPEYLELEVTENAVGSNFPHVVDILRQIKSLGVSIAVDDFGSAHSSLNRLKALPVDCIKLGAQFVRGIEADGKHRTIVRVMVKLIQSLQLRAVAEGVETAVQFHYLAQTHCEMVLGPFCCRPMDASAMEAFLCAHARQPWHGICTPPTPGV